MLAENTAPATSPLRLLDVVSKEGDGKNLVPKPLREFLKERSTIIFLIDDVFRRGWLYTITGNTGAGKTGIAVVLAISVAGGSLICGHECQSGRVLYIAGENADDVRTRFIVTLERLGLSGDMPDSIYVIDQSFLLAEHVAGLCLIIDQLEISLVIVDTDQAVSLSGMEDENSNGERMQHAKQLRLLSRCASNPTVLDLCHPRKNANREDLVPRGGSAFLNEVDGNLRLWRDGEVAELVSDPNKFRGASVLMTFRSELVQTQQIKDSKGRMIQIPFFCPMNEIEAVKTHDAQWRDENRLLWAMKGKPGATQADWAVTCQWFSEDGRTPRRDKVNRLLNAMAKESPALVRKSRGRWYLTKAGEAEAAKA
jgi:hypothetical protein